jgi:hypothetical protein
MLQEEILVKSLEIASTETHTAVGNTGQTCNATKTYTHSRFLIKQKQGSGHDLNIFMQIL